MLQDFIQKCTIYFYMGKVLLHTVTYLLQQPIIPITVYLNISSCAPYSYWLLDQYYTNNFATITKSYLQQEFVHYIQYSS